MTELAYFQVDAFADRPFTGNQAAVMPLDQWLPDDVLTAIAAENMFAETAFFVRDESGNADFALRWFTPTAEVALCGHATLATGHVLLSQYPDLGEIRFITRQSGILTVERDGEDYSVGLPALPPEPADLSATAKIIGGDPVATLRHPNGYNFYRYDSADDVRALDPDFRALGDAGEDLHICTAPGDGDSDVISRVFVPAYGIDEDSVTGAAHAVLTPYWCAELGRDGFSAFQASARGGHLSCRLDDATVWLGGSCVTVVEGLYRI